MKAKEILFAAKINLKKAKIDNPHLEAEILLSHILKKPREYLFAHPEYELNKKQVTSYKLQVTRRLQGVPIAYLTGEKEFYGLKFFVNKNVLIPRPETEMMIDETLKLITCNLKPVSIIDIGTGSGCIAITLAKLLTKGTENTSYKFIATDISGKAISIAKKNAKFHDVNKIIKFLYGDSLSPVPSSRFQVTSYKIITANLPYLTPAQIKKSPSIRFEPKLALAAGPDGLRYYRRLFRQIYRTKMKSTTILCEIDPSQKASIKRLAKKLLPSSSIELKKDLRDHNRLAIIKIA
jgi:release factor glutamine methyltransferase